MSLALLVVIFSAPPLVGLGGQGDPLAEKVVATPFADRTQGVGLDFVHFNGMSGELYFVEMMGSGGALFDYDNDGDLDLYLVQGTMLGPGKTVAQATLPPRHSVPLTDRLYRNELAIGANGQRTLRFNDVTVASGLEALGYGMGVTTGDFDNDGWVDLYVTNYGSNQLWRNNGDGTFSNKTRASSADDNRWSVPAVAFDYDRDGWLDLFIGNYVHFTFQNHKQCMSTTVVRTYCSPALYEPSPDRLLRNRKDGSFEDVTRELGLSRAFGPALGAVAADFDGDGWIDLYVANDGQPNQLWANQGGETFIDSGLLSGSAVNEEGRPEASMGVAAGDFDGDGDEDLFMTHLAAETNTLFLNDGTGMFDDRTVEAGLGGPSFQFTGFGTGWLDYDQDGRLDLLVVNGAVTTIEELYRTRDPHPLHQPNQLFHHAADGRMVEVRDGGAPFEVSEVSRGVVLGDLDNDGDEDVVITNNGGPARILINQIGQEQNWLGLRLLHASGRDALGARVGLHRPGRPPLWRRSSTDGSYASARDPRVLFPLDSGQRAGSIRVVWPNGRTEQWKEVEARRYTTLRQGSGTRVRDGAEPERP